MAKALKRSTSTKALRSERDPQNHKKTKRLKLNLGVSLPHPVLPSFLCGEFLLHIPCCLHFYSGSFSYTSRAGFIFFRGVSLTHPVLASFFFFFFFFFSFLYLGCFSYTSRAGFIFIRGVSLTHPMLTSFLSGEFLLHIPCWLLFLFWEFLLHIPYYFNFYLGSFSYTYRAGFIFIWGVSLTHPVLASFFCGEFLLHIPCWL